MSRLTALRVVVLDGLDWEWCVAHKDLVPELWSIAAEGCAAPLRACDVPITPTGVGALLTGREVELGWTNDHYTSSQDLIRTRPWVHELVRYGMTVGLANVPLTWPAFPLPSGCWMVSGFPVDPVALDPRSGRPWYRPAGLDILGYPIETITCDHGPGGTRDLRGLGRAEAEIVEWVQGAERCDVEIVWLRSTDGAGHHLWGQPEYGDAVRAAVRLLPRLRDGAENLLVLSDHGMAGLGTDRCSTYRATKHGPASLAANLLGGHTMEGVLVAAGPKVSAVGVLPEQKLVEVAGGMFDLLQVPPVPGMISNGPAWASAVPTGSAEGDRIAARLRALGYL